MFDATDLIDLRRPATPAQPAAADPLKDRQAEIEAWARHATASNGFAERPAAATGGDR
jgi:hypothetical protein